MKELDPGHHFALNLLDCGENAITAIRFVKRKGAKYPGNQDSYPGANIPGGAPSVDRAAEVPR